mgnify:CR=1 FL=1
MIEDEKDDFAMGHAGVDVINRAIELPESIQTSDGRSLHTTEWHPSVVTGELIKITATFYVSLSKD